MAKFLNTTGISYHLEELLKNTKDKLILISPYLQFNDRIKEHIQNLNIQKRDIRIIYKENKLHPDESNWLVSQIGVRTSILKTLHAKCYINDHEAIITSMNLYEFSQINNNEMGIHLTKQQDPELYASTLEEAQRLLTISQELRITVQKISGKPDGKKESNHAIKSGQGYCIRTGASIPFDILRPFSYDAFKKWDEHKNEDYKEKYCHFSGESSNGETSKRYPILNKNWKKAEAMHGSLKSDKK